jgi:hypothetical protein
MLKATAIFDAGDSRQSGALARQSRIAKFAAAFSAIRGQARMGVGKAQPMGVLLTSGGNVCWLGAWLSPACAVSKSRTESIRN